MTKDAIDWNEIWEEQYQKHMESNCEVECANIWEKKEAAKRFWNMSQENNAGRILKTIKDLGISPNSRVLDVGAGPGTLAIPLAKKVAHVTAVEPSEGMLAVLKDQAEKEQIDNVFCVQKRWEDVDLKKDLKGPYDVVMASYSLGMPNIKEAIQKMIDASSKYVYLYWFAGESSWEATSRNIWPIIHKREYCPGPKCDVLYNLLYQMGIYANLEVFDFEHVNRYSSLEEAFDNLKSQYKVSTPEQELNLRDFLQNVLEEDNGSLVMRGSSTRVKMWWDKNTIEAPRTIN